MTSLVILAFAVFGVCYIIGHSTISLPLRQLLADFQIWSHTEIVCPLCREVNDVSDATFGWKKAKGDNLECPDCHQLSTIEYFVKTEDGRTHFRMYGPHPLHWLVSLVECPACLSVWLGGAFGVWASWGSSIGELVLNATATATFCAGTSYTLARLTSLIPPPPEE